MAVPVRYEVNPPPRKPTPTTPQQKSQPVKYNMWKALGSDISRVGQWVKYAAQGGQKAGVVGAKVPTPFVQQPYNYKNISINPMLSGAPQKGNAFTINENLRQGIVKNPMLYPSSPVYGGRLYSQMGGAESRYGPMPATPPNAWAANPQGLYTEDTEKTQFYNPNQYTDYLGAKAYRRSAMDRKVERMDMLASGIPNYNYYGLTTLGEGYSSGGLGSYGGGAPYYGGYGGYGGYGYGGGGGGGGYSSTPEWWQAMTTWRW
jgi:hypothetical protein